jgi:crotonobetainyl-CoA:carnitine CoA-transferase CaiB-like acyl-CoA transferase
MTQPLAGIRVIELGMFHAGPGGAAILGDLGAEVLKIEQPDRGDPGKIPEAGQLRHAGAQGRRQHLE